jgi:hypothetical protein
MTSSTDRARAWPDIVRTLLYVAMALFVVTIVIGIVNGLDLYEFDRNQLLTHVHSGTLGWVTLTLVAASFWLFRSGDRRLALTMAVLTVAYVIAFYTGHLWLRATTGVALFVAIAWLLVWAWRAAVATGSLPALAVALGFTTFAYGAVIGVLLQVQMASGTTIFPGGGDVIGAHAGTMVFSYLVLVAMGLIEWRARGTTGLPKAGLVQVGALFGGGLLLAIVQLFLPDQVQSIGGIYLLVELVAIVLFIGRVLPSAVRVDWIHASPARHLGTAAVFVVVAMGIYMYLVVTFLGNPTADFETFLPILVASDHTTFVGVITNLVFALALALAADRRSIWPWADQVVYWLMNVGLVVFAIGLAGEVAEVKRIGAPIMGIGILLGLAVITMRLRSSDLSAAEQA